MTWPDISLHHNNPFFAKVGFDDINSQVEWTNTLTHIHTDKEIKLKRDMAYCSDCEAVYYYDKFFLKVQPYTPLLKEINELVSRFAGVDFNSVLLNRYKDGRDKINWHSDKEEQLGPNPVIVSVNFGAARLMWFLNKETGEKTKYLLSHGDVLVMGPTCQKNYLHAILPEKEVKEPRISLTFRKVII